MDLRKIAAKELKQEQDRVTIDEIKKKLKRKKWYSYLTGWKIQLTIKQKDS